MVNNVYDLVTRTMEQEFPGRVAFRWVEDATGTVKEKTYAEYAQDIRRAAAWFGWKRRFCEVMLRPWTRNCKALHEQNKKEP